MATIVTRAGKGSPLTNAEVDANFTNLNTAIESLGDMSAQDADSVAITGGSAALDSLAVVGPVKVYGANISAITPFSNAMHVWESDDNSFQEIYVRNLNNGSDASADFVAYNDASDVNSYFVDLGMNSSNFTSVDYPIFTPNSAYLYTGGGLTGQQSDLFIGTSNPASDIIFFTGGVEETNQRAMIHGTTGNFLLNTATDTGYLLNVNGTSYLGGATTFGSTVVLNADPSAALQAATKQYVDGQVAQGFTVHTPVRVVANTYTGTNSTYNNGTAGVGATLTATINGALNIDGVTPSVGDRVLLRALSTASHNGVYSVTDAGSAGTPWVLTRATDFDTPAIGNIANNAYFFVSAGTSYKGYAYVLSQLSAITVGTTALPFTEFASQAAYTVNSPLELVGTTLSLAGTVAATNGGTGTNTVATGDLLYGSAANTWSKLSLGSAYKSLVVNASGTQLEWNAVALNQAAAVSGQLAVSNGGSGASSAQGAMNTFAGAVTSGQYLRGNGTNVVMSAIQAADVPTLNQNTTGSSASVSGSAALTVQSNYQAAINTTTPGLGNYGIHFGGQTTADYAAGITWNGGTGTTGAQAGIYVQGSGAYGTKMYLATTSSYASGSQTAISIDHLGAVTINRSSLTSVGNITAYSDETLKTNWRDLPTDFIEQLANVKHGTYDRTDIEATQDGVSAQSLKPLLPNSVGKNEDGKLSVNYGGAAMVSAVQLAKRVVQQDERIAQLEAVVAKLVD